MGLYYKIVRTLLQPVLHVRRTEYAEPLGEEPCVLLANHIGMMGPLYMAATFPLGDKVAIWCNAEMMDEKQIVEYARHDWWWRPESKLAPLYSATLPYIASVLVPALMRSAPTIPVHHDARAMSTLRATMKAFKAGKYIVIFPEKPDGFDSHAEELQMGWLNLCAMYQKATGKPLKLVPVHIDEKNHVFRVGKGIYADPDVPLSEQEHRIERYLAAGLRGQNAGEE